MNQRSFVAVVLGIVLAGLAPSSPGMALSSIAASEIGAEPSSGFPGQAVAELAQSGQPAILGIQVQETANGVDIVLDTSEEFQVSPTTQVLGNALVLEFADVVLALPEGDDFLVANPADAIALITANSVSNRVRITVTGTDAPPTVNVTSTGSSWVLSVSSGEATVTDEGDRIQIIATDEGSPYQVPEVSVGTRIEAPLEDLPLSIQAIPQEVIRDRQIFRLNEVADNVASVEPQSGYGGISSGGFRIRGFEAGFENFRDGFRDFGFITPRDVANIERVEFLRGPASVLYGSAFSLGGAVNTVTEQPLAESRYELSGTIGNYGFYRATADATGPVTEDDSLLYRLNVAYENADSFRDFNGSDSFFIAPVLQWNIGDRTRLTAEFEYQNYDYIFDRGLPPIEESFDIPISRSFIEPDFNNSVVNSFLARYRFEHEFNDQWRIRNGLSVISANGEFARIQTAGELNDDGRTIDRSATLTEESSENLTIQTDLIGEFYTGSIEHNLLFGIEYASYRFANLFNRASIAPIDFFDPQYGERPGTFTLSFNEEYGSDNLGIYLQDLIYLTPDLIVLAGGRFDANESIYRDRETDTIFNEQTETNFSPRLGIVYQPTDTTSLYFNWSNSFNPQIFGRSRTGEVFEPERGEQFEIGIRQEISDRLSANLALYDLTRRNTLTTDPEDTNFSVQTGEQNSQGIEFDLTGEILPGWNIIATYAYTNARVLEDNDIPRGDRLVGIPENSASLWTTYEIQSGDLQGLGFGLGLVYVGEREAQLPNTGVIIPDYLRTDASIFYQRDRYRIAFNVKNLFNTDYYNSQGFYIVPGEPLTVLLNVSLTF